jgi:hypothetical protein
VKALTIGYAVDVGQPMETRQNIMIVQAIGYTADAEKLKYNI